MSEHDQLKQLKRLICKIRCRARQVDQQPASAQPACTETLCYTHFVLVEELVRCIRHLNWRVAAEFDALEQQKCTLERQYDGSDAGTQEQLLERLGYIGDQWQALVTAVANTYT